VKTKALELLQYFFLLSLGLLLSWLFFKDLNFTDIQQVISTGNFYWCYLVLLVSILVYILRVLRWQMLIKATGYSSGFMNLLAALSIGYFVNFAVPRLGEITRCLSVKKHSNIPIMQLLGTVIIERVIDVLCLLLILLLTLIFQFNYVIDFFYENIFNPIYHDIYSKLINGNYFSLFIFITALICSFVLFYYFRKIILKKSPKIIVQFIQGLKEGFISIAKLKQKRIFILYTILIWVCYYLMTYFWFFVFDETSILTWGACLTILSIGTIGRSIPIQGGGMGAYHFLVGQVVLLYGITGIVGKTLATLIHAGQTFFTFAMGLVGLIIFFVGYWRR